MSAAREHLSERLDWSERKARSVAHSGGKCAQRQVITLRRYLAGVAGGYVCCEEEAVAMQRYGERGAASLRREAAALTHGCVRSEICVLQARFRSWACRVSQCGRCSRSGGVGGDGQKQCNAWS